MKLRPELSDEREKELVGRISAGKHEWVQKTLEGGADPNAGHGDPLDMAIENKDIEMVKLLLNFGATISGMHLVTASRTGNIDIATLIAKSADDISAVDKFHDETALHKAASFGATPIVEMLLEKGADVHLKDKCGCTALHKAASDGVLPIVEMLVERGADIHAVRTDGKSVSALDMAAASGHTEIVKFLLECGARHSLRSAVATGNLEFLRAEKGIDKEDLNELLLVAAETGQVCSMEHLIQLGADVNYNEYYLGRSPLFGAVRRRDKDAIKFLIEHGARPDMMSSWEGPSTPLDEADAEIASFIKSLWGDASISS
jgi:uncharacterized protein